MRINHSLIAAVFAAGALITFDVQAQNVGIGVSNPQSKLSVNGSTSSGGLAVGDSTYTSTAGTVAPTNGAIIAGFVGIGTTLKTGYGGRLTVVGDNSSGNETLVGFQTPTGGAAMLGPSLHFYAARGTEASPLSLVAGDQVGSIAFLSPVSTVAYGSFECNYNGGSNGTILIRADGAGRGGVGSVIDLSGATGNVGVNITTPIASLHVAGSSTINISGTTTYFSGGSASLSTASIASNGVGIYSEQNIWTAAAILATSGTITSSDSRLKNIIGHSDAVEDLNTLKKIDVIDYTYIDKVTCGDGVHKKVIAQQLEKVFPEAVTMHADFLPDIFAVADKVEGGDGGYVITTPNPHGIQNGERVRLILEKGGVLYLSAKVIDGAKFFVAFDKPLTGKVFVYGREHNDVRGVDYDAISMLNVSATQELAKKVEALEAENAELKAHANRLATLEARMEELEKSVSSQRNGSDTIRPVALNQ